MHSPSKSLSIEIFPIVWILLYFVLHFLRTRRHFVLCIANSFSFWGISCTQEGRMESNIPPLSLSLTSQLWLICYSSLKFLHVALHTRGALHGLSRSPTITLEPRKWRSQISLSFGWLLASLYWYLKSARLIFIFLTKCSYTDYSICELRIRIDKLMRCAALHSIKIFMLFVYFIA